MDEPNLNGIADYWYQCSGEFCHSAVHTLPSGDVLFFGNWENEMRIYRISGWSGWKRDSGVVKVATPSADQKGQGLTAEYFDDAGMTMPKTVHVDEAIDFKWGDEAPPATEIIKAGGYGVRWRGTILPEYGPAYTGPWSVRKDGKALDGAVRGSRDDLSSVEFRFGGTSVSAIGNTGPDNGFANVYLDGQPVQQNIDCYSDAVIQGVKLFTKDGLTPGDHVLKVEVVGWRGKRNPKSKNSWVYLDRFVVDGIEHDDGGIAYTMPAQTNGGLARLWVNRLPVTEGAPVKLLRMQTPIQFLFTKTKDSAAVTLKWSSPFTPSRPIPTSALYPVAEGAPQEPANP